MNKKYIIGFIFIILLIVASVSVFLPSNKETLIVVGAEAPPHTFIKDNQTSGITVELIEIIFNKLGVDYEIKLIPWSSAISEMKEGRADVIMDAIPTRERMRFLMIAEEDLYDKSKEGIDTRWTEEVVAAYKKNSDVQITTKEDLGKRDYRVGIINGYFYLGFDFSKYNIYSYEDSSTLLHGLDKGEIDIAIVSKLEAKGVIKSDSMENIELSKGLFESHYLSHILFSNVRNEEYLSQLKTDVEKELITLKESGDYDRIYNKYLEAI